MSSELFDGNSNVLKYAPDLHDLYAVFTVPVVIHDREHRVVSLNRAMSGLLGIDTDAIMGRRCQEVLNILDISTHVCPFHVDDSAGVPVSCQVYILQARSNFLLTRYPVFDDDSNVTGGICVFNEIPAPRHANTASSGCMEQCEALLDVESDFLCWKDGEGLWQYVNRSGRKFFRFDEKDYAGKTDFEIAAGNILFRAFFTECAAIENEAWNTGRASTSRVKLELTSHRISTFEITKVPFFNSDGTRKGVAGVARDITRSVTTEQELHSAINQLNIILENISSAIALLVDRKIIWANPAAERLLGYSAGEVQGCTTEIFHVSREDVLKNNIQLIDC